MNTKLKNIDKFIKKSMKNNWDVPGLAVVIFDSDKNIYKYINGFSNLKTKNKLKITDKFCTGSTGKCILCTAISIFIQQKKLPDLWNMTLEEAWSNNIHSDYKKVKVKNIATHTSGIRDVYFDSKKEYNKIFKKMESLTDIKQRKLLANIILKKPTSYIPGSRKKYSNWGYGILGAILEKWSNMKYYEVIDEAIMKPLKIDATYKYTYGSNFVNGHSSIWWDKNSHLKPIPLKKNQHIELPWENPAGTIYMSILDCVKFCQIYLKTFNNKENLLELSTAKYLTKANKYDYGYGWDVDKKNNIISHGGMWQAMTTSFLFIPNKDIGIIICYNIYDDRLSNKIKKVFLDNFL